MNVPKLRFKDFDGEWEEKKLIEVANVTMGQSPKGESYTTNPNDTILIQGNADIINEKVVPRIYTNAPTKMCEIGDVILSVRAPVGEIGISQYRACLGRGVCSINSKNHFIYHVLSKFRDTGFWKRKSQGSTFESINGDDIKGVLIHIPTISEQNKISTFFDMINKKIQLQQEKMDLLKEQKKGYMQKIFTQELRFKDEYGQDFPGWSKVKLGKLTKKTGKKNSKGIKYPVAAISNKKGFTLEGERNNSNADVDIKSYKLVKFNEFAYNPSRINVGSFGFQNVADVAIVSSLYVIFETLPELENAFLKMYMHSIYFNQQVKKNTEGSVREYLFYENFSNIKIPLPCIEEQQKISSFMDTFDLKINLAEQKLEQLMEQKQAFMQQMFI